MSPKSVTMLTRNRHTPNAGKGRFQPTEPLHMTTRHAARSTQVNDTSSLNGSVDGDDFRRSSLDNINPTSSQSLGSPNSAKGRRISGNSINGAPDVNMSFESRSSGDRNLERSASKTKSPVMGRTTSPTNPRKRKRTSLTQTPPDILNGSPDALVPPPQAMRDGDPREMVEVVGPEDLSDRDVEDQSQSSQASDDQFAANYSMNATQSTENTPVGTPTGSQAVSPVSEESHPDLVYPAKQLDLSTANLQQPVEQDEPDEVEDVEELIEVDDVDEADDVEDGDEQVREDGEGRPRRRLAGRRRAEHPDPLIEATMRRQLQLKSAFRAITRSLKPVLAEISQKTVEGLEEDPNIHEQALEYQGTEDEDGIQKQLDDALAQRKAQLDAQLKWNKQQLQKTLTGETTVRKSRCDLQIEDLRDLQLDRLEHDLLVVARQAQLNTGDAGYETEDESDDVVPQPQGMSYRFVRTGALDSRYDSRSRLALECEQAIRDLQTRFDMFKMLRDVDEEDRPDGMVDFTVMDNAARDAADANRESIMNTNLLADAAAENERVANMPELPPVIPNEHATGLQMLGSLASDPSIRAPEPQYAPQETPRQVRSSLGPAPPSQMLPPPSSLRHPMPFEGPSLEMSPRSAPFPDQFSLPRPPPLPQPPPRQETVPASPRRELLIASPMHQSPSRQANMRESPIRESLVLSPPSRSDRSITLPSFVMPPSQPEHQLRQESVPPQPSPHRQSDIFGRSILISERAGSSHSATQASREEQEDEQYHRPLNVDLPANPALPPPPEREVHEFSAGPLSIQRVGPVEQPRETSVPAADHQDPVEDLSTPLPPDHRDPVADLSMPLPPSDQPDAVEDLSMPLPPSDQPDPVENLSMPLPASDHRDPVEDLSAPVESSREKPAPLLESQEAPIPPNDRPDSIKDVSPSMNPVQPRPSPQWEAPSSPGAADLRQRRDPTPTLTVAENGASDEPSKNTRSRTSSSISRSTTTEASPDVSVTGEPAPRKPTRQKHPRGEKTMYAFKASKDQRQGSSRKIWKHHRPDMGRKSHNTPNPTPRTEAGPTIHRFRLNVPDPAPPAPPAAPTAPAWPNPPPATIPMWSPQGPYPPPPVGHPLPPPPPAYPYPYPYDYSHSFQHRNSFPSAGQPWASPSHAQSQSPLYAVPQPTQPPGGVPPPDQWPSPSVFAPPPPRTPVQPPAQHFGGPTLAPATASIQPRVGSATAGNHLPAFAQQQRNQEANPRRRTQSEVNSHSFKAWVPKPNR